MHYLWAIDIERKTRKKRTIFIAQLQHLVIIFLVYRVFFFFSRSELGAGTVREGERDIILVGKQERKKATLTEINSFLVCVFLFRCFFVCSFLAHHAMIVRPRCMLYPMRKCILHCLRCEKKTNMIYCLQKCDNRNSCIDFTVIRIGISTSSSSSSSSKTSNSRFCNRDTFISVLVQRKPTRKWIFCSNLCVMSFRLCCLHFCCAFSLICCVSS